MIVGQWRRRFYLILRDVIAFVMGLRDPEVPFKAKLVAFGWVVYLLMPLDIIPDVIPVVGWLDDLAMIPLAAYISGKLMPFSIRARLRARADTFLVTRGSRTMLILVGVGILWLLLGGLGGWLLWRHYRQPSRAPQTQQDFHNNLRNYIKTPQDVL